VKKTGKKKVDPLKPSFFYGLFRFPVRYGAWFVFFVAILFNFNCLLLRIRVRFLVFLGCSSPLTAPILCRALVPLTSNLLSPPLHSVSVFLFFRFSWRARSWPTSPLFDANSQFFHFFMKSCFFAYLIRLKIGII